MSQAGLKQREISTLGNRGSAQSLHRHLSNVYTTNKYGGWGERTARISQFHVLSCRCRKEKRWTSVAIYSQRGRYVGGNLKCAWLAQRRVCR